MKYSEPLRALSNDDMERIHQAALTILEDVGMKIDHPEARSLLKKHGCVVEEADGIVKFPKSVVQRSVALMRKAYAQPDRAPERMAVRFSHVRFRSGPHRIHEDFTVSAGGFCCFIFDLEGNRRPAAMDDVRRSISLANRLDDIDYTGLPVSDQETPTPLRPVAMAAEIARLTTKFGGVETFRKEDIPYLIEIATIVKGSADALRREPILVGYGESRSPLCLDYNMADIFMDYIRRGFPQTMDTMPNGGATAPMTAAGVLALGAAESLGPMVLAHAIDPDAIVGVDVIPSQCDMQSGIFRYSSPERWTLLAARVQLLSEYYGCPSGVHGLKTDSCFFDEQAGIEKAASTIVPVLAGAVGVGTCGHLENAVTFSPVQLVIDNEIAAGTRAMLRGIEVNDETLAVDVVREVGPGGNFLGAEHTARHFRDELFLSSLFTHTAWDSARATTEAGMADLAKAKAAELWARDPEPALDERKLRDVEAVVERARKELVK